MKYICNAHPRVREYGLMVSDTESWIISDVVNAEIGVEKDRSFKASIEAPVLGTRRPEPELFGVRDRPRMEN